METNKVMLFCIAPLTADNYFTWSDDIKVVLCGTGVWKYVRGTTNKQITRPSHEAVHLTMRGRA